MSKAIKLIALRMNKSSYRFFFTTLSIKMKIISLAFNGFYAVTYYDANRRWEVAKIYFIEEYFNKRGYVARYEYNQLRITWVENE